MGWEEGAMAPILSAANEKGLDRDRARLASQRKHVRVSEAFRVHRLAALDVGQRPQPISIDGRQLVIVPLGGKSHLLAEAGLHAG